MIAAKTKKYLETHVKSRNQLHHDVVEFRVTWAFESPKSDLYNLFLRAEEIIKWGWFTTAEYAYIGLTPSPQLWIESRKCRVMGHSPFFAITGGFRECGVMPSWPLWSRHRASQMRSVVAAPAKFKFPSGHSRGSRYLFSANEQCNHTNFNVPNLTVQLDFPTEPSMQKWALSF